MSDAPPYRDVVRQSETGLLVRNQPGDWLAAIRSLVDDPILRRRIQENARRDVTDNHTLQAQTAERQAFWGRLLA
jgi:glycosyltransferase involved in cell wall biosynthesis